MKSTFVKKLTIIVLLVIWAPASIFSQKIYSAEGRSEVLVEKNMSKEEARELAEKLAIINAIQNVFTTSVDLVFDWHSSEDGEKYDILASTALRGEWIETKNLTMDEEYRAIKGEFGQEIETWIICKISGLVRERTAKAKFDFITLNCPQIECRETAYKDKDSFFLYFKSPVDGYLSVFLDDRQNTFRLLPYKSMGTRSAVKIKADKDYLFFSKEKEFQYDPQDSTDEIELHTEHKIEYNDIYIVFAENPYPKPILNEVVKREDGYYIPRSLSSEKFQEWLSDCRAEMTDFQAVRVKISIER